MAESNIGLNQLMQALNGLGNAATQQQQLGFGQNQALAELGMRQKAQALQEKEFADTMAFRNRMLDMYNQNGKQNPKDILTIQGFGQRLGMTANDPKYNVNGKYDQEGAFRDVLGRYPAADQAKIVGAYGSPFDQALPSTPAASGPNWIQQQLQKYPALSGLGAFGAGTMAGAKFLPGWAKLAAPLVGMAAQAGLGAYGEGSGSPTGQVAGNTPESRQTPFSINTDMPDMDQNVPVGMPDPIGLPSLTPSMTAKKNAIAPTSTAATRRVNRMQLKSGPVSAF